MTLQYHDLALNIDNFDVQLQGAETNDPDAHKNWAPGRIGTSEAWKVSTGEGIVVAVVDTGVDVGHVELDDNIWTNPGEIAGDGIDNDRNGFVDDVHGWNFGPSGADADIMDRHNHGTHVAGIIAAEADNGVGMHGIAPDAEIMAVKVLNDKGSGDYADIAAGIDYAVENGARIINMSIGGSEGGSAVVGEAISRARDAGVLVVAAAGNKARSEASYPAHFTDTYDNVLSVAALSTFERLAPYSNRSKDGSTVDLTAPGSSVYSTVPGDSYKYMTGTSMAAPVVAAAAAIVWAAQPSWSYLQVIDVLESTVEKMSSLKKTSATDGLVDLAAAIEQAAGAPAAPQNAAPTLEVDALIARLAEGDATPKGGIRIADITVEDDGVGVAILTLSGADASDFVIRGDGLYLREGVVLDFETRPELTVTISVDDPDLGKGPEASRDVVLSVEDLPEGSGPPQASEAEAPSDFADLDFWFDVTAMSEGSKLARLKDLSGNGNTGSADGKERGKTVDGGLRFDGGDVYELSNSEEVNQGGPYEGKTLSLSIETGADVDTRQFLYEQGGKDRGLSVSIEDGEIHVTGWNMREKSWSPVTASASIEANDEMAVSLVLDARAGTLSSYVDGALADMQSGTGMLHSHKGGVALGGVISKARDADGSVVGDGAGNFVGTIFEAASHSQVLVADEIADLHEGFAEAWDAGSPLGAVAFGVDEFVMATQAPPAGGGVGLQVEASDAGEDAPAFLLANDHAGSAPWIEASDALL